MSKRIVIICIFFMTGVINPSSYAGRYVIPPNNTVGWHWYNEPSVTHQHRNHHKDKISILFSQLTARQQLKLLQLATEELKAKAVLSGKVEDIANYKRAQDMWVEKASRFTIGWERMLLSHPELNYALKYSHANSLVPMKLEKHQQEQKDVIRTLAKTSGFLLFYRGREKEDNFYASVVKAFSESYHISVLPISEDGVLSKVYLTASQQDPASEKAKALGISYYPALVLVNLKTNHHQIISYGFMSQEALIERVYKLSKGWRRNF